MSGPKAPHRVVLCFDTLGDLTLRQPLFRGLLDGGDRVTIAVRRGFETLVPFLDGRLGILTTDLDPYQRPDENVRAGLRDLRDRIAGLEPASLVCPLYDRTFLDEWLLRQFPDLPRMGFASGPVPAFVSDALRALDSSPASGPLTRAVECAPELQEAEKNRALLETLTGRSIDEYEPVITLGEGVLAEAAEALNRMGLEPGRYALGCPAGIARIALKAWPVDSYVELLVELKERYGLATLAVGAAPEAGLLEAVQRAASSRSVRVPVWIGSAGEIGLLLGLIGQSRLYLGADTGPMHFAGALGVPVLARFGGGHWPRFLPRARRSFVATWKLPCFGCGWHCWLGEPMCVTRVTDEALKAGLAWILSDAPDERRVDGGEPLDPVAAEVLEKALRGAHQRLDELLAMLDRSEAESTARLEQLERSEAESTARLEQLERSEAESAARLDVIRQVSAGVRSVQALLESAAARHLLDRVSPWRWVRMQRAIDRSRSLLRGLLE